MVDRASALDGLKLPREFGSDLTISERRIGSIWQITAWPGRIPDVETALVAATGVARLPGPLEALECTGGNLLRTEPLRWLLVTDAPLEPPDVRDAATLLDLSHARTIIRVEGATTPDLLARLMPMDFREGRFPEGRVATSGLHHATVACQARAGGIELSCPRSLSRSICEHLMETAAQFRTEA